MARKIKLLSAALIGILFALPTSALANFSITEIMYDPKDSDASSGGEWIEVKNESAEALDLTTWLFFEANTNHGITSIEGGSEIPSGGYAVISRDTTVFKNFFTGFSGRLFKASFSLSDGETLGLKNDKDGSVISSVTYTSDWGAKNDGNSLQKSGTAWIAAVPTPSSTNATSPAGTGGSSDTSNTVTQSGSSVTSSSTPIIIPQIYAEAPEDKIAMALADIGFTGKAYDIKKEPFKTARFLWNFGDGQTAEGQTVLHSYVYPGEYLVHLYVSSGEYTATDTLKVKVVPSTLSISDVSYNNFGAVTIANSSDNKLDVSFWRIKSGKTFWSFPRDSYILPKGMTVISGQRAVLEISPNYDVLLLYPNYDIASRYQYAPQSNLIASSGSISSPKSSQPNAKIIKSNTPTPTGNVSGAYAEVIVADTNSQTQKTALNENLITEETLANASASTGGSSSGIFKWAIFLAGFLGLIIFSLFYFRDKVSGSTLAAQMPDDALKADDFDIEEEMP